MAKARIREGVTLTYPAMTPYKQWVWEQIRARGKTLQWLVDEMKRVAKSELMTIVDAKGRTMYETLSTSTVSQLLGPAPEKNAGPPPPSNCAFMPALNRALGIAPPPVCTPSDELAQIRDRFSAKWTKMTPRERRLLLELLGDETE